GLHRARFLFFTASCTTGTSRLSLHDALPICRTSRRTGWRDRRVRRHSRLPESSAARRAWRLRFESSRAVTFLAHRRSEPAVRLRSEEHTSELQSRVDLVCRLLLEKKHRDSTT